MIFVDNLGFVTGLPWWTQHMSREANGMTYVDMVFPAFLFLMGMAIPVSIDARKARRDTTARISGHVLLRSLTLVALGLFVANAPQVDAGYTGLSFPWWAALVFVAIILVLIEFPGLKKRKAAFWILKLLGLALFVSLLVMYRRVTAEGGVAWLDFSDWEILGLLGWAYFSVAAIYLWFGKKLAILVPILGALVAVNALSVAGRLAWLQGLPPFLKPFEAGMSSLTMAGLLASLLIVGDTVGETFAKKARCVASSAAVLLAVGYLLRPLGISKIRDTPTWCLYCMAANLVIAMLLYWIADVQGWTKWAGFTRPVGQNPLLSYFLPYVAYFSPTLFRLTAGGTSHWLGVWRSFLFAAGIWMLVSVLDRLKVRLRV